MDKGSLHDRLRVQTNSRISGLDYKYALMDDLGDRLTDDLIAHVIRESVMREMKLGTDTKIQDFFYHMTLTGKENRMNDEPIAVTAEGRPIYDNTPTVVCMIVENTKGQILAVRRASDPGKDLLGLPGGYHMRGESWQQAGVREVAEETGIALLELCISLMSVHTDEYGNNLAIARHTVMVDQKAYPVDGEALEIVWLSREDLDPTDWAFPRHYDAVTDYFVVHHLGSPQTSG